MPTSPRRHAFPSDAQVALNVRPLGLTVREYFMAHAPAQPQPWFEPVVPPKPMFPDPNHELNEEQRHEWRDLVDSGWVTNEPVVANYQPDVLAFVERFRTAQKAYTKWDALVKRERYVQWPAAWADAVLASGGDE